MSHCINKWHIAKLFTSIWLLRIHSQLFKSTKTNQPVTNIKLAKTPNTPTVSVEYLPKDLSYSAGTPPLVLCTEAASRCRKLTFAETYLTNDGVKSIVYEVTQSGRRLKEWTIPLACQCHSLFSIHLFTYSAGKQVKKVAHTRLPSVGFQSWSQFLAVSLQVAWVINPVVGCHYFLPGLQLPPQPLRGLLPILLLGEQRHDGCEQFA